LRVAFSSSCSYIVAMNAPSDIVRARIDKDTKAKASAALAAMGLSVSDAIRMLLRRVADEQRLPFEVTVPNAETRAAITELEAGKGKRFKNAEALFDDLGI
jgi:DNA-damage-inducible protein J